MRAHVGSEAPDNGGGGEGRHPARAAGRERIGAAGDA